MRNKTIIILILLSVSFGLTVSPVDAELDETENIIIHRYGNRTLYLPNDSMTVSQVYGYQNIPETDYTWSNATVKNVTVVFDTNVSIRVDSYEMRTLDGDPSTSYYAHTGSWDTSDVLTLNKTDLGYDDMVTNGSYFLRHSYTYNDTHRIKNTTRVHAFRLYCLFMIHNVGDDIGQVFFEYELNIELHGIGPAVEPTIEASSIIDYTYISEIPPGVEYPIWITEPDNFIVQFFAGLGLTIGIAAIVSGGMYYFFSRRTNREPEEWDI